MGLTPLLIFIISHTVLFMDTNLKTYDIVLIIYTSILLFGFNFNNIRFLQYITLLIYFICVALRIILFFKERRK